MQIGEFCFNDTATTEIYTRALHDALPIFLAFSGALRLSWTAARTATGLAVGVWLVLALLARIPWPAPLIIGVLILAPGVARKSTRLNSSHANISYAVFCLTKNNTTNQPTH